MLGLKQLDEPTGVITIAGMRGYGKTYLASKIIEAEVREGNPVIIFDLVGAFTNYLPYPSVEFNTVYGAKTVSMILDKLKGSPVILNLSMLTRDEMTSQADIVLRLLMADKKKFTVFIDEVGELIPQRREVYSTETERLIRIGRNLGLGKVYLTTQRLQQTDKTAIAQSSYYIIFRMVHNLDVEAMQKILGWSAEEMRKLKRLLSSLNLGEFIVTEGLDIEGIYKYNNAKKQVVTIRAIGSQTTLKEPEQETEETEQPGELRKAHRPLAGKCKEILEMRKKGATLQDIATKYGASPAGVTKAIRRCKK